MRKQTHKVELTSEERQTLETLVRKGEHSALKLMRAHILLKADRNGPSWTDARISEAFGCDAQTAYNVRKRFATGERLAALERKPQSRPSHVRKLDGQGEVRLIALACSDPPEGFSQWTLQLLADELVDLQIVESISIETVRQTPKKNALRPHRSSYWVIPPDEDAAFVAAMEAVLEVYQRPEDVRFPVVAMDERPVQLLADLRSPIPVKPGRIARIDYEYKRIGSVSAFLFTAPFQGWRRVSVRERRTAIDWAEEVKHLLDEVYPDAERVTVVCDNLNTHRLTSLYKAFPAEEALGLASRLEIVYTPKHGSWLNIAEIELSVFSRQCLNRRIPDIETLRSEAEAWQTYRNQTANRVDWRFTTQDARIKLKRLYPQTQH
ncbi:IS630 family transposase [Candidatus Poribacteria bacterium]|nr:IS630 family transposase [Candidatus Poribacteria bacterium]MYH81994.1 IS630 family transposase [Candidatus Poribacteria bacterium]